MRKFYRKGDVVPRWFIKSQKKYDQKNIKFGCDTVLGLHTARRFPSFLPIYCGVRIDGGIPSCCKNKLFYGAWCEYGISFLEDEKLFNIAIEYTKYKKAQEKKHHSLSEIMKC